MGITDALVNAGGDLRAIGSHGDRPWRIAIRDPRGGVVGSLETGADEAIFTSGNYERFREDSEKRYPHILDPRNGWPVTELSSVTVIAGEGLLADAAATALIVAGPDEWKETARAMGLEQVLVVDANGKVFMTPRMAERVRLNPGIEAEIGGPAG
jgi:thiamine biosynthesis lipoprotein